MELVGKPNCQVLATQRVWINACFGGLIKFLFSQNIIQYLESKACLSTRDCRYMWNCGDRPHTCPPERTASLSSRPRLPRRRNRIKEWEEVSQGAHWGRENRIILFNQRNCITQIGYLQICDTTEAGHSVDRAGWQAKLSSIAFWIPWRTASLHFKGVAEDCLAYNLQAHARLNLRRSDFWQKIASESVYIGSNTNVTRTHTTRTQPCVKNMLAWLRHAAFFLTRANCDAPINCMPQGTPPPPGRWWGFE